MRGTPRPGQPWLLGLFLMLVLFAATRRASADATVALTKLYYFPGTYDLTNRDGIIATLEFTSNPDPRNPLNPIGVLEYAGYRMEIIAVVRDPALSQASVIGAKTAGNPAWGGARSLLAVTDLRPVPNKQIDSKYLLESITAVEFQVLPYQRGRTHTLRILEDVTFHRRPGT